MIRFFMFAVVFAISMPVFAQNNYDGWRQLGEALFGSEEKEKDAYEKCVKQALERENSMLDAMEARGNLEIIQIENAAREQLKKFWISSGLTELEAISISSEFRIQNRQISINARAQRDGIEKTLVMAFRAYESYDYILANQLLVAAERINGVTPEQLSAAVKAVEIEKTRIGISSGNP